MGIQVKGWPLLWMVPLLFLTRTAAGSDPGLVVAVREGDHTAVRALLEGDVDVNAPQVYGATVLAWAADRNDLEMLEDLIKAAVNAAVAKSQKLLQEEMGKLTGGLNIPGMDQLSKMFG